MSEELVPGDRVRLPNIESLGREFRLKDATVIAPDDPRILRHDEWPGFNPSHTGHDNAWIWLDEKISGHHSWQFSKHLLERIYEPISDEELAEVYRSLGVRDA